MRKRDLGILLLCAFAIFFSLQHEGDFSFKEAWFHLSDEYPIKYEADRLPPPIIADLNGDGRVKFWLQLMMLKFRYYFGCLEPHTRRIDEGFSEARVLGEVSLLPDKVRVSFGRRPVAMSVGVVDRSYKDGEVKKQVLVVEDFPHGTHHREIAISISNYTLKHGDAGLVILGEEWNDNIITTFLYKIIMSADAFEETLMGRADKDAEHHRRSANEKEANGSSDVLDQRHFALYAFAGRSGTQRWSRKNENVHTQQSDQSLLIPQHNYKLDAQALNTRHPGEFECREFRESILGVMPHQWDRREDTSLQLTQFRRHKRKLQKKNLGRTTINHLHAPVEKHAPGKDSTNKIANVIGKAAKYANSAKAKKKLSYFPTITNHTQLWWLPNVVVAHEKEGIEAIHLASGRTLCKLHLPEGGLHADINGDGVLDHVQAVGGRGVEQTVVSGSMEVLRPCWAVATSGVPVREQLFNVSICQHAHFNLFYHSGDFARTFGRAAAAADTQSLEVATPILLPRPDGHRHRKGSHGDVIFLNNRGEMTAYSPGLHGEDAVWRWQITTGASWTNPPFRLRAGDQREVVIAAGDQEAAVVSPGGVVLASVDLPAAPTHALVLGDFSGDGLADIILQTSGGVYGFVQTRQPGAIFFSGLVGCLIVVMGVIFVTQHLGSAGQGKPRAPPGHWR
ncbi:unnamed protein product [Spirodela intermedia]|uniref:Uncharacterized protein n=1 Tax=Spirodela intermedia TaxID=51605 RepID=A0A7I8IFJ8_SPIIN|nr:unnamed protein product [Spirodela intermedia]CAA6656401.1 unnamed protein product [Spirodela intermedia]